MALLRARAAWPSLDDRARFTVAMDRAETARAAVASDADPSEEEIAAFETAVAQAWQLHQVFRVGEDARARR